MAGNTLTIRISDELAASIDDEIEPMRAETFGRISTRHAAARALIVEALKRRSEDRCRDRAERYGTPIET